MPRPKSVLQDLAKSFPDIFTRTESNDQRNASGSQTEKLRHQIASATGVDEAVQPLQKAVGNSSQVSVVHLAIEDKEPPSEALPLEADPSKGLNYEKKTSENDNI
jgi:hypothetical protein